MIPAIIYALWCVFFAYLNYILIERLNERVRHGFNGLAHLAVCIYFSFALGLTTGFEMLLIGRLFFDTSLNLVRKKGIGYVPENPKSIVDKVEKYVFNDGITPKVIYAYLIIVLMVISGSN